MSYTLIDTVTGTILDPVGCVLVEDSKAPTLCHEESDFSDSEICEIGKEHGRAILPDSESLDRIASLLAEAEWDVVTIMQVSEIVQGTGRVVVDVETV